MQWGLWVVSSLLKTEKFYDLAGSTTFVYLVWQTLFWTGRFYPRQVIQSTCITAWALRLGLFLFSRILREGGDSRFNKVRDNPGKLLIFWTVQGIWVYMTLLPTIVLHSSRNNRPLCWKDYLGWVLWALGFCIQVLADHQKTQFRSDPLNHKRFITSGLWSMCRHPNYLGEILMWFGLFLPASSVMYGWQFLSIVSPAFVAFLLIWISGIPIQEAQARRRWSNVQAYVVYRKNTAKLIPGIWWLSSYACCYGNLLLNMYLHFEYFAPLQQFIYAINRIHIYPSQAQCIYHRCIELLYSIHYRVRIAESGKKKECIIECMKHFNQPS